MLDEDEDRLPVVVEAGVEVYGVKGGKELGDAVD